ncbi:acetyltransferase [Lacticaseibacillus paracasei]|uniref:Acetyltransferase n=1 Tax=Lacticaseibacillus paracasei TaxID=1597 RepID=A0AB38Q5J7_LACPA|nr:acetyltransferase [Lacticaseibacillus paracasei subsp. tolerans]MCS6149746.1 acetyltransferase [Lacticaseibacillus paracasei]MCT3320413.1 acetyltransferase [Lacticaseibacillus paracasei]MCT3357304.1 acetyltransferase [Lacticaseibacillus paracasei]MCT3366326.1 acetyltransferase [Lacticaseibacillus paracasei]
MILTRSPAQKPAYKDLKCHGQAQTMTLEATYTPVSNRAGSRSDLNAFTSAETYT